MSDTNNTIFEFTAVYQTNDITKEHYKNGTVQQHNVQKNHINPYNIFKNIETATEQINTATFNYTKEVNDIISKLVHKTFEHITLQHDEITKLQSHLQLQLAKTRQLQENRKQDYYHYDVILENITEQLYNKKLLKRVLKNWHNDIRTGPINMARAYSNKVSVDSTGEHDEVESIKNLENEILKLKTEKSTLLNSVKNAVTQGLSFITNETMKALDSNEAAVKSPVSQHSSKTDEFAFNNSQSNSIRYPLDNCQICSCNFDYMCQNNLNNPIPMQHCNCKSKFTSICCDNVRQMHDFEIKHGDKNDSCSYQQSMFDSRSLSDGPQFLYNMNNGYTFFNRYGGGTGNNKNIIPCFGKRPYIRMPHNKRKKKNMQQRGNAKLHKQMESSDFNQQTDILKNSILNNKRLDDFNDSKKLFKTNADTHEKANDNNQTKNDTKPDNAISAREKLEKALFRSVENYECNSECCCNLQNEESTNIENLNSGTKSTNDLNNNTKPMNFRDDDNSSENNSESKTQINYIELSNNTSPLPLRQQIQSPRQTVTNKRPESAKLNQFGTKIDVASLKKQFQQEQFPKTMNGKCIQTYDCASLKKCTYFRNISENSSSTFHEEPMEYINDYNRTARNSFLTDDGSNKISPKRIFNRTDKNQKMNCACLSVCTCPIWCTLDNIDDKVLKKTSTNTSLENSPRSDNPLNSDCKCLFRGIH